MALPKLTTLEIMLVAVVVVEIFATISLSLTLSHSVVRFYNVSVPLMARSIIYLCNRANNNSRTNSFIKKRHIPNVQSMENNCLQLNRAPVKTEDKIVHYPFLISINRPIWSDSHDKEEFILHCSGIILNQNNVLTGLCVNTTATDWYRFIIRAGSDFWSVGGTVHEISSVTYLENNFTILEITPNFQFNSYIQPVKLSNGVEWKEAEMVGWFKSTTALEKYNPFKVEIVNKTDVMEFSEKKNRKCDISSSGNILVYNKEVVGLNVRNYCLNSFGKDFSGFQKIDSEYIYSIL